MITSILQDESLTSIMSNKIKEHNVGLVIDSSYYIDDLLDSTKIVNLEIDKFYNSQRLANTPPSIDNLVAIKRTDDIYTLYLIELKDVQKMKSIGRNIEEKFKTTIDDFMAYRYRHIFQKQNIKYTDIKLLLVCNRFKFLGEDITDEQYERKIKNSIVEKLLLAKPIKFNNIACRITPVYTEQFSIL